MSPNEALAVALQHHRAGRLEEAARTYREILKSDSANWRAWHLLGMVFFGRGDAGEAVTCFRNAVALNPVVPETHNNLGMALLVTGAVKEGVECFQRALELNPNHPEANHNLGNVLNS